LEILALIYLLIEVKVSPRKQESSTLLGYNRSEAIKNLPKVLIMPDEEVKPNLNEASTQDAQLAADNIASGEEEAPTVDFDADYTAAQKFSVSEVDRTGKGAAAAEAATAPEQKISQPQKTTTQTQSTGNPDDFKESAKEVGNSQTEVVTDVSDDLVEEALEKGERKN
jgi:hypothetical protein